MANPVPFRESNLILHGPQGVDDPDVLTIEARRLEGCVVTCWQLSPEDVAEMVETGGVIWVSVWGNSMPPMMVTGRKADVI